MHRKVVFCLAALSCVIFITENTGKTGNLKPLMLQNIMGTPLLSWLVSSLETGGCGRFFLVCPEAYRETALACFPDRVSVTAAGGEGTSDLLHVFLSTAEVEEKEVTIITQPVLILPKSATPDFRNAPVPTRAFAVSKRALMSALDDSFSFQEFFVEHGRPMTDRDGWYTISSAEELADWQSICNRETLCRLARNGVEIWDYSNCYVDPDVFVGPGTVLLPGTVLKSGTVIGRNCRIGPNAYIERSKIDDGTTVNASQIYESIIGAQTTVGPFAYIRPGTVVGKNCRVGDFVELKNSTIGDGTKVSHLTYVGDSDVGAGVNFGCGTVTVNYDRAQKHRTVIGNNCFIGCNTNLVAPVTLGDGAYTAAGSTITQNVPEDALAIERGQMTVKKDWAKTHKVKEKK